MEAEMALGWQPMELGEWREQMLFAQPPSLSLRDQCQAGGMGRGRMGEGWHLESWHGGGGGLGPPRLGSAGTGCRLSTLPSVSLLPTPHSLSFSLSPSSTAKRKEENRVLILPTPNLYQTPSPPSHNSPHHTTTKPSVLSLPGSVTGHLLSFAFTLTPKRVQCF